MNELTTEQLLEAEAGASSTLTSLVDALESRPDMQDAIRELMSPDDMLETFSVLAVNDPDLMRLTLQANVAALVNFQTVSAVKAELTRRAASN